MLSLLLETVELTVYCNCQLHRHNYVIICFVYRAEYRQDELEKLALEALPSCHQPLVISIAPRAWLRLLAYLGLDPSRLVATHSTRLKSVYITNFTPTEVLLCSPNQYFWDYR